MAIDLDAAVELAKKCGIAFQSHCGPSGRWSVLTYGSVSVEKIAELIHLARSSAVPEDDFGRPIIYDTEAVDNVTHALTGDEGEDDSVTVLEGLARYAHSVWPGKTVLQLLSELEEAQIAAPTPPAIPKEAEPTLEQLQAMAYELQLLPVSDAVPVQIMEILKRQFNAAMKVAAPRAEQPEPKQPADEELIDKMVDAYNAVQSSKDRGRAQQEMGMRDALQVYLDAAPSADSAGECIWTADADLEGDTWDSSCGEKWSFIDGGPEENRVRFCHGCGCKVSLAAIARADGSKA